MHPDDVKPSSSHPVNGDGDAGGVGRTDADDGAWLNITVWDQDVGRDEIMGVVDIPLRNIPLSALQAQHLWFPINCSEKATKHATDSALTGGTKNTADTHEGAAAIDALKRSLTLNLKKAKKVATSPPPPSAQPGWTR